MDVNVRKSNTTVKNATSDYQKIIEILNDFPDDKTSMFTKRISEYIARLEETNKYLDEKLLNQILVEQENESLLRFKAFYTIFTYHHSKKDYSKCCELVRQSDGFEQYPLWYYAVSTCSAWSLSSEYDVHHALENAKKCIKGYEEKPGYNKNYGGIYHNYSEIVCNALEKHYVIRDEEYLTALDYISKARDIDSKYAKYLYTNGRLLMLKQRYAEASRLFEQAIDQEVSEKKDYSIRISEYSDALTRCQSEERLYSLENEMKEKLDEMNLKSKKMDEELADQKKQMLELLGFFSGIISLIIVTTQIGTNLASKDALIVMVVFLGVLLVAFSYLGFMTLRRTDRIGMRILFLILGIALLAMGIFSLLRPVPQKENCESNVEITSELIESEGAE